MYTSHKFEKNLAVAMVTTATGVVAASRHYPGLQKQVVRGFAALVLAVPGTTAPVIALKKRPTPGSATGESTIATLTIPTTSAIGQVYYKRGLNVELQPGDELVIDVTTASVTTGTVTASAEMDQTPELPANLGAEVILSA